MLFLWMALKGRNMIEYDAKIQKNRRFDSIWYYPSKNKHTESADRKMHKNENKVLNKFYWTIMLNFSIIWTTGNYVELKYIIIHN